MEIGAAAVVETGRDRVTVVEFRVVATAVIGAIVVVGTTVLEIVVVVLVD